MNFRPSDYICDLNLELNEDFNLGVSPNMNNDLDLFSKDDFYNLDFKTDLKAINEPVNDYDFHANQTQLPSPSSDIQGTVSAANEDKRKRNTAASARFRIKKKLKEQQMEQKAKELQDKVNSLEKKLLTVEMENKCLKSLILKKNEEDNVKLLEAIKKRSITDSKPILNYTI